MERRLKHLLDGGFKLRHLQLITAIANNGTIVGAARDLYVTQPVVTRGLREAEEILGVELFDRSSRGVTPTAYGTLLLEHAEMILTSMERLAENIDHLQTSGTRPIRVGTNMTGSYALLPRTLISVKAANPALKVSVVEGTDEALLELLAHHKLDVLIGRMMNDSPPTVVQRHLYDEPIRIMGRVGHPVFAMDDLEPEHLAAFPWVLPPPTAVASRLGGSFGETGSWVPTNVIECTSILTIRSILHATDSLAPLPVLVGTNDPGLRIVPWALDTLPRALAVTHSTESEPSESARLFIEHLLGEAKAIEIELSEARIDLA
ncbi:LysR family transcriptional regulator [Rhodococcus sp. BP-252]|uniref:LysR family transcriptional regulator n=1 Tax=unclassified Rhodococcus (in: high G+C Gram-positive bacteria) TaxID=192944 RepID=UPI001431F74B|nr:MULTISPECIES: LysR family transcriptional regulator [unclassified Rhodococcus (in: high G+C Gram-positive bacteria)]MBY6414389.1 LysR family transcriptional regulator [Rhodococcus sp. BP-320]MBY6419526.1 LysR family transcriptional regulator [Rhodococcus sp. BP-321]MBY6424033.1 LysR family transcriptional regulator [Rhodococcus sp. BP-324]MBY6429244.1 LysR family transcriptional regulator [Rhodococcus sp. BP-323]MBY6434203.1 LysR family transcriptional regulator [Rhodococcus sp. BP-322]